MCQPQKEGRDGHFLATFGRASTKDSLAFVTQLILSDPFLGHSLFSSLGSDGKSAPFNLHKQGLPFQGSAVSETQLHLSLTFSQSPKINTHGKSVHLEKQFLLLWIFVVINLLPTQSHER